MMKLHLVLLVAGLICVTTPLASPSLLGVRVDAEKDAKTFSSAIEKLNASHAKKPADTREADLAKKLPKKARAALGRVLDSEDLAALERCSEAALELALVEDFNALRERRAELAPDAAKQLPVAHAEERFLLIGTNGLDSAYLEHFAEVMNDVLTAYDETFAFEEFSKVPGKKLRVLIHLEEKITRPPHFAPEFDWHSLIDFPVIDAERFNSPTPEGQFLFYGLCHELGHVIAMWGGHGPQQDHHAWAHYTGMKTLEHLNERKGKQPKWMKHATDYRWKELSEERKQRKDDEPGLEDRDAVLALLLQLDELVGPQAIGAAFNELDRADKRKRIKFVRYYTFEELAEGLDETLESKKERKAVKKFFAEALK